MPSKLFKIDFDKNIAGINVSTMYQNHHHDMTVVKSTNIKRYHFWSFFKRLFWYNQCYHV